MSNLPPGVIAEIGARIDSIAAACSPLPSYLIIPDGVMDALSIALAERTRLLSRWLRARRVPRRIKSRLKRDGVWAEVRLVPVTLEDTMHGRRPAKDARYCPCCRVFFRTASCPYHATPVSISGVVTTQTHRAPVSP